jgi:hypothetical protein
LVENALLPNIRVIISHLSLYRHCTRTVGCFRVGFLICTLVPARVIYICLVDDCSPCVICLDHPCSRKLQAAQLCKH